MRLVLPMLLAIVFPVFVSVAPPQRVSFDHALGPSVVAGTLSLLFERTFACLLGFGGSTTASNLQDNGETKLKHGAKINLVTARVSCSAHGNRLKMARSSLPRLPNNPLPITWHWAERKDVTQYPATAVSAAGACLRIPTPASSSCTLACLRTKARMTRTSSVIWCT